MARPLTKLQKNETFEGACEAHGRGHDTYYPVWPNENKIYNPIVLSSAGYAGYIDLLTPITLGKKTIVWSYKAIRVYSEDLTKVINAHKSFMDFEDGPEDETEGRPRIVIPQITYNFWPTSRDRIRNSAAKLLERSGDLSPPESKKLLRGIISACDEVRDTFPPSPPSVAEVGDSSGPPLAQAGSQLSLLCDSHGEPLPKPKIVSGFYSCSPVIPSFHNRHGRGGAGGAGDGSSGSNGGSFGQLGSNSSDSSKESQSSGGASPASNSSKTGSQTDSDGSGYGCLEWTEADWPSEGSESGTDVNSTSRVGSMEWNWDSTGSKPDDKLSETTEEIASFFGKVSSSIGNWITTADSLPNPELDGSPEDRMQRLKTLQLKYSVLCKWTAVLIAKESNRKAPTGIEEIGESTLASETLKIWYHPILDAVLRRHADTIRIWNRPTLDVVPGVNDSKKAKGLLVNASAVADALEGTCRTALQVAAGYGHESVVELLLAEAGADTKVQNSCHFSAGGGKVRLSHKPCRQN